MPMDLSMATGKDGSTQRVIDQLRLRPDPRHIHNCFLFCKGLGWSISIQCQVGSQICENYFLSMRKYVQKLRLNLQKAAW